MKLHTAYSQFTKARTALITRRSQLQEELEKIDEILSQTSSSNGHVRSYSPPPRPRRTRTGNKLTLREAISQVVRGRALTKQEIIAGVTRIGYKFSTNDPAGSLNALLYSKTGRAAFKNQGGKFSVR